MPRWLRYLAEGRMNWERQPAAGVSRFWLRFLLIAILASVWPILEM